MRSLFCASLNLVQLGNVYSVEFCTKGLFFCPCLLHTLSKSMWTAPSNDGAPVFNLQAELKGGHKIMHIADPSQTWYCQLHHKAFVDVSPLCKLAQVECSGVRILLTVESHWYQKSPNSNLFNLIK